MIFSILLYFIFGLCFVSCMCIIFYFSEVSTEMVLSAAIFGFGLVVQVLGFVSSVYLLTQEYPLTPSSPVTESHPLVSSTSNNTRQPSIDSSVATDTTPPASKNICVNDSIIIIALTNAALMIAKLCLQNDTSTIIYCNNSTYVAM